MNKSSVAIEKKRSGRKRRKLHRRGKDKNRCEIGTEGGQKRNDGNLQQKKWFASLLFWLESSKRKSEIMCLEVVVAKGEKLAEKYFFLRSLQS